MASMGRERYHFVQMTPAIRRRLEATLENLIHLLDALDGDPDDETTTPEQDPDFGHSFPEVRALADWQGDDLEDGGDAECSEQSLALN